LPPTIDASLERTGQAVFLPERHRLEGVLLAARGDAAAAVAPLVRAIDLAREQSGLGLALRAAVSLAELERDAGIAAGAAGRLREIVSAIPEGREEPDMRRARALLVGPKSGEFHLT